MAGPALALAIEVGAPVLASLPSGERRRELGRPGVPRLPGMAILPVTSAPPPWRRRRISGQPLSQRALALMRKFPEMARAEERTRFAPLSPREPGRVWR